MNETESEGRRPLLAVLSGSDAFERLWDELAEAHGADLRVGAGVAALAPAAEADAVLVVVASEEGSTGDRVRALREAGAPDRIAVVGVEADHRLAVAALRAGASEFFALPGDAEMLRAWVAERVRRRPTAPRGPAPSHDFSRLIGESEGLRAALTRASRVIPHGVATVLLTGETGTGKELLARAIHDNGPRSREPFVEVNCSALPANLLEAELFGYEKGAFTGAVAAKPGLFEAAHRGTLFLDEIGELPIELQAKLLRALESRSIRRVGSVRPMTLDVRIVAATNRDLAGEVKERRFREDLFYRLNVLPIELPPLRERDDDVLVLADHFLTHFSDFYGIPRPSLDAGVRTVLRAHSWPGNVRELRNAVERALLLGDGELRPEDLLVAGDAAVRTNAGPLPFPATMDEIEAAAAHAMVERFDGNKTAAADALGISRSRLYRLLGEAS